MSIDIKVLEDNPTIDVTSENDSLNISMVDGEVINVVDYNLTIHKPSINGNILQGDKSSSDLGLADKNHTHKKADITDFAHTHDDRYYLKSATDSAISKKATELGTLITASGHTIDLVMDSATYELKALLYDGSGKVISTSTVIDLPLETLVLDVSYNSSKKSIIIKLENGTTKEVPVGDLINGLVNEATFNSKVNELNASIANAKITADSAKSTIDELKIGGRNLKINSDFKNGEKAYATEGTTFSAINDETYGKCAQIVFSTAYASERIYTADYKNVYNLRGVTYTVSFVAKASANKELKVSIAGGSQSIGTVELTPEWKRFEMTYTANVTGSITFKLNSDGTLYLANIKIEKGNKATDWTPAPEDKADKTHTHKKAEITDFAHTHDDRYYQKTEIDSTYIKSATASGRTITFTKGDGSKSTLTTQDTTYGVATQSSNGLLSSEDKKKLDELSGQTTALINRIYPVGAIYLTYNDNNPSDFLGGTWERFGQGRTLIGEGTGNDGSTSKTFEANSSGGEYNHTLVLSEMPIHSHRTAKGAPTDDAYATLFEQYTTYQSELDLPSLSRKYWQAHTEASGGSKPHNNIQPYITVYFWRRTA